MSIFRILRHLAIFSVIIISLSACRSVPIIVPGVGIHVSGHNGHPPAHAPAHGRRAHHNYHYYPDSEVYFDISRRSYFYLSGGNWTVSATLPHALRLHLGSHVSLELDTAEPYHRHHTNRKHYPRGYFKKKHRGKHKNKKNKKRRGRGQDD